MKRKSGAGSIAKGLAEDARPVGFHVVLGVAKIDEGEGRGLAFRGAEVKPLGPVGAVADAVGVERIGGKAGEFDGVEVGLTEIGGEIGGARRVVGGLELGVVGGESELGETAFDAGGGAPSDGLGGRRVAGPREHDAVGQRRGGVGEFLGVRRGLPGVGGRVVREGETGGEESGAGAQKSLHFWKRGGETGEMHARTGEFWVTADERRKRAAGDRRREGAGWERNISGVERAGRRATVSLLSLLCSTQVSPRPSSVKRRAGWTFPSPPKRRKSRRRAGESRATRACDVRASRRRLGGRWSFPPALRAVMCRFLPSRIPPA